MHTIWAYRVDNINNHTHFTQGTYSAFIIIIIKMISINPAFQNKQCDGVPSLWQHRYITSDDEITIRVALLSIDLFFVWLQQPPPQQSQGLRFPYSLFSV